MSNKPLISIIIPAYNAEKTIVETLISIQQQQFKEFEVIIVNDGSIDKTADLVMEICNEDSRFILINQRNSGVSAARNAGLDNVRSDWVCFIDADDIVSSNYLFELFSAVSDNVMVCASSIQEFRDDVDNIISKWNVIESADNPIKYILNHKLGVYVWGKIYDYKKIIKNNLKFNTNISVGEDFEFNIRYIHYVNQIKFVQSVYFYRIISNSLSHRFDLSLVLTRLKAAGYIYKVITDPKITDKEKDILYINYGVLGSLRYLFKHNEYVHIFKLAGKLERRIVKLSYLLDLDYKWRIPYLMVYFLSRVMK